MAPAEDEAEITILGPGKGESVIVHTGGNQWLIADCCVTRKGGAAPLEYLDSIGVGPESVHWVVATHWHDDHVRGFAELARRCANAEVIVSAALELDEFLRLAVSEAQLNISGPSGVKELSTTLGLVAGRHQSCRFVSADKRLYSHERAGNIPRCEIWTLSPSDDAVAAALADFASWAPRAGDTKRAIPRPARNPASTALWIEIGATKVLLGADLEAHASVTRGWQAVVRSTGRPQGKAHVVKVPHHGSSDAHDDEMWTALLVEHPHAGLTPMLQGSVSLPRMVDRERIVQWTPRAWVTRETAIASPVSRGRAVERTIKEVTRSMVNLSTDPGRVTFRCSASNPVGMTVDAPRPAALLIRQLPMGAT